jgi:hypothetical protein
MREIEDRDFLYVLPCPFPSITRFFFAQVWRLDSYGRQLRR